MNEPRPIFLLTDFGPGSYYQGVMKGVIASISPGTAIHDLSHGLGLGQLREAGFVLQASLDHLPPNAIVVVVVDPEVGTERRIIALSVGERTVLAPDNGLLTEALDRSDATVVRAVENPEILLVNPSATFHGRDIFAPVAARLSLGMAESELGAEVGEPVRLPDPESVEHAALLEANIVHVDAFGNLITDATRESWIKYVGIPSYVIIAGSGRIQRLSHTFGDVKTGEAVAYIGSTGHLEVAIRDGNASETFGVEVGGKITVHKR